MKCNPDMDKSAVWAGTGCMAVSPISGLRFMSSPSAYWIPVIRVCFPVTGLHPDLVWAQKGCMRRSASSRPSLPRSSGGRCRGRSWRRSSLALARSCLGVEDVGFRLTTRFQKLPTLPACPPPAPSPLLLFFIRNTAVYQLN